MRGRRVLPDLVESTIVVSWLRNPVHDVCCQWRGGDLDRLRVQLGDLTNPAQVLLVVRTGAPRRVAMARQSRSAGAKGAGSRPGLLWVRWAADGLVEQRIKATGARPRLNFGESVRMSTAAATRPRPRSARPRYA